jgi:hypothetical protein
MILQNRLQISAIGEIRVYKKNCRRHVFILSAVQVSEDSQEGFPPANNVESLPACFAALAAYFKSGMRVTGPSTR